MSRRQAAALDYAVTLPELAPFAMFELDLGQMTDGNGQPVFPELNGQHTPLWEVDWTPQADHAERERVEREAREAREAREREARVESLAAKYAGVDWDTVDPSEEGEDEYTGDENTHDEWRHFWGGDTPTQRRAAEFAAE